MGGVCLVLLIACLVWFKEFKLVSFDPGFARGMGLPVAMLEQLILLLTVIANERRTRCYCIFQAEVRDGS